MYNSNASYKSYYDEPKQNEIVEFFLINEQKQINTIKEVTENMYYGDSPRRQNDMKGMMGEELSVKWIDDIINEVITEIKQEYPECPPITYEASHNRFTIKNYKRDSKRFKCDIVLTIQVGTLKPFKIAIENKLHFKPTWVTKAWITQQILKRFTLYPTDDYLRLLISHGIPQTPKLNTMLKTHNINHVANNYVNTLHSIIHYTIKHLINRINNVKLGIRRYTYSIIGLILNIESVLHDINSKIVCGDMFNIG